MSSEGPRARLFGCYLPGDNFQDGVMNEVSELLAVSTTPRPPTFSYMVSSEDYDPAFYFLVLGSSISSIGLIFFGIHKAEIAENSNAT